MQHISKTPYKRTPLAVAPAARRLERFQRAWTVFWYNIFHRFPFLNWPFYLVTFALSACFFGALALVACIEAGAFGQLPDREDLQDITNYIASEVISDDDMILGRYYFENRSNVPHEEISPAFIQALLATEDARFMWHDGVDLRSWGRVFFKTLLKKERSSGGGSTITQQLAKNLYPREEYPYASLIINKLREVFIARRIEMLYSKEEILELYLNTVAFSENTYGIKVAAQRFFNTTPKALTAEQSAVLVGMLKAPSAYNPTRYQQRATERRDLVLGQMVKYGYLTPAEADSLIAESICLNYYPLSHDYGPATYFREHLRLEARDLIKDLRKPNGMAYNLYTDGLRIYTTIDSRLQHYAELAVVAHMKDLQKAFDKHLNGQAPWEVDTAFALGRLYSERYRAMRDAGYSPAQIDSAFAMPIDMTVFDWETGERKTRMSPNDSLRYYLSLLNAGFLAMEPSTGEIKAWVGGIDYKYFKYDHVKARRQVGSTFKPVVYAAAIHQGILPCSYTPNVLRTYPQFQYWTPQNATNKYGGFYSMEGGLIQSINTVTVNLAFRARIGNVAQLASDMGISSHIHVVPAIALGAIDASLQELVTVYGTFANRGLRPEPMYIRRIETRDGQVLIDFEARRDTCEWRRALFIDEADMINHMLRSAVNNGTGRRLRHRYKLDNDVAGKTGTSQNHSDGWFIGYNPKLVAGAWVGGESPAVRFRDLSLGQGANTALPIFALFLDQINRDDNLKEYAEARFSTPSELVRAALNCAPVSIPQAQTDTEGAVAEQPGGQAAPTEPTVIMVKNVEDRD
jgi:penicillin-binding protein 1A